MAFTYEHIDDNTTRVSGYTVPIKDILKRHKGSFDTALRAWLVPRSEVARLQSDIIVYENHQKQEKEKRWNQALAQCGLDFVRKDTADYYKVLAAYKKL